MESFLAQIFKEKLDVEYIQISTKAEGGNWHSEFYLSLEDAEQHIESVKSNHDVYFGVAPRGKKAEDLSAIGRTLWIWADIDNKGRETDIETQVKRLKLKFCLPPTFIISSGHGLHVYWKIEPCKQTSVAKKTMQLVTQMTGADKAINALTSVLRIPDTWNLKDNNDPKQVFIVEQNPEFVYKIEDFIAASVVPRETTKIIATGDQAGFESRSERDYNVCVSLLKSNLRTDVVRYIFDTQEIGDRHREDMLTKNRGDYYFREIIEKIKESGIASAADVDNRWSLIEKNNCYYQVAGNGQLIQLSTFVFEPDVLLEGDIYNKEEDTLLGTVKSDAGEWRNIALTKSAFNKVDQLNKQLLKAQWQWLGSDRHVKILLPYLLEKLIEKSGGEIPSQRATPILGRHGENFVAPKQTVGTKEEIVWLPTGREHPEVVYQFDTEKAKEELNHFLEYYFNINHPHVVWMTLGWYVAALFKPILEKQQIRFPGLNLYGTRGSGKTSLLGILQQLVGYQKLTTFDANTTPFVLLSLLASSNAIPISISEYRRTGIRNSNLILRYILLGYDTGYDSRGHADQTTQRYPLCSPVTVDGEDAIVDSACLERIIQINLRPETISENSDQYKAFLSLTRKRFIFLPGELIKWTLDYVSDWQALFDYSFELIPNAIPDRIRRNVITTLWGIQAFSDFCAYLQRPIELPNFLDLVNPILEQVINMKSGRTQLIVDEFIEEIVNAAALEKTDFLWKIQEGVFYFQLSTAFSYWAMLRRRQGLDHLDKKAIRQQLREREADYVVNAQTLFVPGAGSVYMYGINLEIAVEVGLDIPEDMSSLNMRLKEKTNDDQSGN
jgi:hypothetical protein